MMSLKDFGSSVMDGTLLIQENTRLPESWPRDNVSIGEGWARIPNHVAFEKKLAAAGWTLFFRAGSIKASALGFDRQKMIETAIRRLLSAVSLQKCNCMEVDNVRMQSFFGIPYVTIMAHSRHVQQAVCL
jgi:hypothetical protein